MENLVFQEEKEHLEKTEKRIHSMISRYNNEVEYCKKELMDFICVDYDDVDQQGDLRKREKSAREEVKKYTRYLASPYYARVDLKEKKIDCEVKSIYIGKNGISDKGDIIVVDWREDIARCFEQESQDELTTNGIDYTVFIRRKLTIKNASLVECTTIYDRNSQKGNIVDPYLKHLLQDKRRIHALTDIIETIQENQSEIIRRPVNESFIVQGCAGSGKTMILIHRLSYIVFNNRRMNVNTIKIITPNEFFGTYIKNISKQLEIAYIKTISLEQYYASIITRYSVELLQSEPRTNEEMLEKTLLNRVYSIKYMEENISSYHDYWEKELPVLRDSKLQNIFRDFQIKYPDTDVHTVGTVETLEQGLQKILRIISDNTKKEETLSKRLVSMEKEIASIEKKLDINLLVMEKQKEHLIHQFEHIHEDEWQRVESIDDEVESFYSQNKEILQNIFTLEDKIKQNQRETNLLINDTEKYTNYKWIISNKDKLSKMILENACEIVEQIEEIQRANEKIPAYNFSKRGFFRKQLQDQEEKFLNTANCIISDYIQKAHIENEKDTAEIQVLEVRMDSLIKQIDKLKLESQIHRTNASLAGNFLIELQSSKSLKIKSILSKTGYETYKELLEPYIKQEQSFRVLLNKKRTLVKQREELQEEYEQVQLQCAKINGSTTEYIEECMDSLEKLQFIPVFQNVFEKKIIEEYKNYSETYTGINYKHILYLKLLCCNLYFSRNLAGDTFLCIDEAQDISKAEYKLLRTLLGKKCIFNLYGDINQSIYNYTEFMDWDEINDIINGHFYILQENYRNTVEITDFCNDKFGAEISAIGISGKEVIETDLNSAIESITAIKKREPEYRVAVLHKSETDTVRDVLKRVLSKEKISWYSVDMKKISVLTVESARGLEFDSVVVLDDQMSESEKYISYTRALNDLIVVHNYLQ